MRARALNIYVCDQKSEGFELTDCFFTVACFGSRAVDSKTIIYNFYFVSLRENN